SQPAHGGLRGPLRGWRARRGAGAVGGRALVPRRRPAGPALAPQHRALHPRQPRRALAVHVHHEKGELLMAINRMSVGARLSGAVVRGDTCYHAGQVAADPTAGVKGQTEQILKKFDELLAAAGSSKAKLLSATVWLARPHTTL